MTYEVFDPFGWDLFCTCILGMVAYVRRSGQQQGSVALFEIAHDTRRQLGSTEPAQQMHT